MNVVLGVLGGILLVRGLRSRSLGGFVMLLVGGWMVSRAVGGTDRVGDMVGSYRPASPSGERPATVDVSKRIVVSEPAEELYERWRDPAEFSQVMGHFAEVTARGQDRFEWTVDGPRGRDISWETRIVEDEPGEIIRWETPPDATIPNEGTVRFHELPGDRGTEVSLSVTFDPPGGPLANVALSRLDIAPELLVGKALDRFKSLAESGEIPTLEKNPSARGRGDLL